MLTLIEEKKCLYCEKNIRGRTDKKFCNDYCRNYYNNRLNGAVSGLQRNINHVLSKNRRILESMIPAEMEMIRIKKEKLVEEGFQFRYITHLRHVKKTGMYYHCYDYGYMLLQDDWCLIFKG